MKTIKGSKYTWAILFLIGKKTLSRNIKRVPTLGVEHVLRHLSKFCFFSFFFVASFAVQIPRPFVPTRGVFVVTAIDGVRTPRLIVLAREGWRIWGLFR